MCNRPPSPYTDGVFGNYERGRQLLAFEFIGRVLDFVEEAVNQLRIVSGGDDFGG